MTRGKIKRDIEVILYKVETKQMDFCSGRKEIYKVIDKIFDLDIYNALQQCHRCKESCECNCEKTEKC